MTIQTMIHTKELNDKILSIIGTAHKVGVTGGLGLKTYQPGGLEFLPVPSDTKFLAILPAVVVKPVDIINKFKELGESYETENNFRIVYCNLFSESVNVMESKMIVVKALAELFYDDITLGGVVLTNGQIVKMLINIVEYEPPEDEFVSLFNARFFAIAMNLRINVDTNS